ncbi:MAG: hypothetical protein CM15mP75_6130 [Flammeovirgaceae bacterium]|nr:MAG: hypothetical protein CM15mP75_6130 [Flammeovirgaceae bacterium]
MTKYFYRNWRSNQILVGKRVAVNLEYFGRLKHKDDGSQSLTKYLDKITTLWV